MQAAGAARAGHTHTRRRKQARREMVWKTLTQSVTDTGETDTESPEPLLDLEEEWTGMDVGLGLDEGPDVPALESDEEFFSDEEEDVWSDSTQGDTGAAEPGEEGPAGATNEEIAPNNSDADLLELAGQLVTTVAEPRALPNGPRNDGANAELEGGSTDGTATGADNTARMAWPELGRRSPPEREPELSKSAL